MFSHYRYFSHSIDSLQCYKVQIYDILSETKGILIFTFVTGNLFITLPLIVESVKDIYVKYKNQDEYVDAQIKSLIPVYYSFPGIGKL